MSRSPRQTSPSLPEVRVASHQGGGVHCGTRGFPRLALCRHLLQTQTAQLDGISRHLQELRFSVWTNRRLILRSDCRGGGSIRHLSLHSMPQSVTDRGAIH